MLQSVLDTPFSKLHTSKWLNCLIDGEASTYLYLSKSDTWIGSLHSIRHELHNFIPRTINISVHSILKNCHVPATYKSTFDGSASFVVCKRTASKSAFACSCRCLISRLLSAKRSLLWTFWSSRAVEFAASSTNVRCFSVRRRSASEITNRSNYQIIPRLRQSLFQRHKKEQKGSLITHTKTVQIARNYGHKVQLNFKRLGKDYKLFVLTSQVLHKKNHSEEILSKTLSRDRILPLQSLKAYI